MKSSLLLTLVLIISSQANAIEGGTPEALLKNQETLKSVVYFFVGDPTKDYPKGTPEEDFPYSCTGTLVSQNIFLTARHCVDKIKDKKTYLNGEEVKLYGVEQPKALYAGLVKQKELTDVALVLFSPIDCAKSVVKTLPTLPIAKPKDGHTYSSDILMSGYGISSIGGNDSGRLRAGVGKIATSKDVTDFVDHFAKEMGTSDALISISKRMDYYRMTTQKDDLFNPYQMLFSHKPKVTPDGTATTLPGDSGGSAIGFDENGHPTILGVTSQFAPEATAVTDFNVSVRTRDRQIFTDKFTSQDMAKIGDPALKLVEIVAKADMESPLVTPVTLFVPNQKGETEKVTAYSVLQDFQVSWTNNRTSISEYTSVTTGKNAKFIEDSMSALTKIRAKNAAQICSQ